MSVCFIAGCKDGWFGSKCDLKRTCKGYEGYGEGVKILSNGVDTAVPAYCKGDGERINDNAKLHRNEIPATKHFVHGCI